jgi:hypothetical protein
MAIDATASTLGTMTTLTHTTDAPPTGRAPTSTWSSPAPWARWSAYAVAAWAVAFAGVNFYLLFGGTAADSPLRDVWGAMIIMNVLVIVLKGLGAATALASVQSWGRRLPAWLLSGAMWGAGGLLLLYAGLNFGMLIASGQLTATTALAGGEFLVPAWTYATFFGVPGLLFAAAGRDHQRRTGTSLRWAVLGLLGAPALLGIVLFGVPALLRTAGMLPG